METPIKRSQRDWDTFFCGIARAVAALSKDPDRQVGAVIVANSRRQMSFGYNGFPPGVEDTPSSLADREFKLANMVHAEANALRQAPFAVAGCTMYATSFPCLECAQKLKDAGVARIVAPTPDFNHHRWGKSWRLSFALLKANEIEVAFL